MGLQRRNEVRKFLGRLMGEFVVGSWNRDVCMGYRDVEGRERTLEVGVETFVAGVVDRDGERVALLREGEVVVRVDVVVAVEVVVGLNETIQF